GAGAGLDPPGVQGRRTAVGGGLDPAAAAVLDALRPPAELRGPDGHRAAGAQPEHSPCPLALVAQAFRPSVRGRAAALAELQVADCAGLAGGLVAGRLRGAGPVRRRLEAPALPVPVLAGRVPADAHRAWRRLGPSGA